MADRPSGGGLFGKMKLGAALLLLPSALVAEGFVCDLEGRAVSFAIDPTQFAAAKSVDEPPRRAVTRVELDGQFLVAEAISLDGWRGFHTNAPGDVEILMMVAPDGAASLSVGETMWRGRCEVGL